MQALRALVLSGGGGRGAFHAGVYQYLSERGWQPDVVVGTSIGAVNGAAIVQGLSAAALTEIWRSLEERDIQGLPPGMRGPARWVVRKIFNSIMDAHLPQVSPALATSTQPEYFWPPLPLLPRPLANALVGKWINLLDTGPLKQTLQTRFGFDARAIANSRQTLVIAATNVQTGARQLFSNRPIYSRHSGSPRPDVSVGITPDRILASCSIPLVYPWTYDQATDSWYWDGAVVANTPLGAALDAMQSVSPEAPAEVVVVLMTPWRAGNSRRDMPRSFGEAVTWTLDWALLASFRERLRLIEAYNRFAEQERASGPPPYRYRLVHVRIAAPEDFLPAARIIDYDGEVSAQLIRQGYQAARRAFEEDHG